MRAVSRRETLRHLVWAAVAACAPATRPATAVAPAGATSGVTLVKDGRAIAAIFVAASVMSRQTVKTSTSKAFEAEKQRQRLRDSVLDLSRTLQEISGGRVAIVAGRPALGDERVPILIGDLARETFGAPTVSAPFRQGFRLVVSAAGVGLLGESDLSTSYAIYELLDRLGCRWFIPSEMGEVLPSLPTITLAHVDFSSAPSTTYRGLWYADDDYRRRNRHGGVVLDIQQCLELYASTDDHVRHPEWTAQSGGKPVPGRIKWSDAGFAAHVAETILARFARDPVPSYSLSPNDGYDFDQSKDDKALDAGDFDPEVNDVSLTDRLLVMCNRIATRVSTQAPDVLLGVLAYVQFTRAPVRETVHPSLVPSIAPIMYSRFHPMDDDAVPGNRALRSLIVGWGKAARQTSFYAYGYNLAEPTAPQPMLAKWSFDVPFILANGCRFWQPETLPNFETHMQALYLANRLAWNAELRPREIIDEIHALFYGHAAQPMAAYWKFVDDVWVKTPEYAGCAFSYQRRWTPERLKRARGLLDAGRGACVTDMETRRVQLAHDSFDLFERFMKMRFDLANGAFHDLGRDAGRWRRRVVELAAQYGDQHCFSAPKWSRDTVGGAFFKQFFQRTYEDASSISRDFEILTPSPIRHFRWEIDPDLDGERRGWARPDFDDRSWKSTDVCEETWSSLGHHDYFKSMWYRAEVHLPAGPSGTTYLWFAATDGSTKVFVNGIHVPYMEDGVTKPEFEGFSTPASFDVSHAVTPGSVNHVAILCTRKNINEIGTGGLLGPVVLYRSKQHDPVVAHSSAKRPA